MRLPGDVEALADAVIERGVNRDACFLQMAMRIGELGERVADLQSEVMESRTGRMLLVADLDERDVVMRVAGGEEDHRPFAEVPLGDFAEAEDAAVEGSGCVVVAYAEHDVADLANR